MSLARRISSAKFSFRLREHRPTVVLALLVTLSITLLFTGTEAFLIHRGLKRAVALTAYPFLEARRFAEQSADYAFDFVFGYDALRDENEVLRRNLMRTTLAKADSDELRRENRRLRRMLDFVREQPRVTLTPVQVVQNAEGMLTINQGASSGLKPSMPVLALNDETGEGGVVGVITEVNDFTSSVATLHHMDCKVGAMVLRNRLRAYDGIIHGSGSSLSQICTMEYIDMSEEDAVRVGDIVVTSPESLFPSGYLIGTVSAPPHGRNTLWRSAEITPAIDPLRVDEVFVVRQGVDASDELAGPARPGAAEVWAHTETRTQAAKSNAPALPDMRSIQERYAP